MQAGRTLQPRKLLMFSLLCTLKIMHIDERIEII